MHATAPLGRRPELDGLRTVAVLAVVGWPLALVVLLRFAPSARRQAMILGVAIVGVMALRSGLSLTHAVSPSGTSR